MQGFNYNLTRGLVAKLSKIQGQNENGHFRSQNGAVSRDTVHLLQTRNEHCTILIPSLLLQTVGYLII